MRKSSNNKNQVKSQFVIDIHLIERFKLRFSDVNFSDLETIVKFSKKYNSSNVHQCPFDVVKNKIRNYSNQVFLVNTKFNMILVQENNTLKNVLYLDGTDGYNIY
jgi:hypothetical protein